METACSSGTSVSTYNTTCCHNPEDTFWSVTVIKIWKLISRKIVTLFRSFPGMHHAESDCTLSTARTKCHPCFVAFLMDLTTFISVCTEEARSDQTEPLEHANFLTPIRIPLSRTMLIKFHLSGCPSWSSQLSRFWNHYADMLVLWEQR